MAINISTDVAVTTGGKLTDIGAIQGGWKSVSTYSDMAALTGSATLKGKLQNGQVFYVINDQALYSLSITGNAPFQTYSFSQFEFPMTSSIGGSTDISALNTFTGSIQTEVNNLTSATSSYILVSDTSSMFVSSSIIADTASFIDPTFISASAAASGFGSGEGIHTDISALNIFTGSIQSEVDSLTSATSSYILVSDTASMSVFSALTASYIDPDFISASAAASGFGEGIHTDISALNIFTGSIQSEVDNLTAATSSYLTSLPSGIISSSDQITITESQISDLTHTDISDLNTFSGSVQSQVDALIAATSSYLTSETDSQTLSITGLELSISNGNTITLPTTDTSSFITNDQTASMSVATASYAEYAVSASYEISYEVSSSYADSALTASYIDPNIVTNIVTDDYISSSAALSGFGAGGGIFTPTGSVYATTNDLEITGSLSVNNGVLKLDELTTTPSASGGSIFYSASAFYVGID